MISQTRLGPQGVGIWGGPGRTRARRGRGAGGPGWNRALPGPDPVHVKTQKGRTGRPRRTTPKVGLENWFWRFRRVLCIWSGVRTNCSAALAKRHVVCPNSGFQSAGSGKAKRILKAKACLRMWSALAPSGRGRPGGTRKTGLTPGDGVRVLVRQDHMKHN